VTDRRQWRCLLAALAVVALALPASAPAAKRSCRDTATHAKRCHARSSAPRTTKVVGSRRGLERTGRWAPFALD
jgi:hypothetical protein